MDAEKDVQYVESIIVAVKDKRGKCWLGVSQARNVEIARRDFVYAVQSGDKSKSLISRYPGDFSLWKLGDCIVCGDDYSVKPCSEMIIDGEELSSHE